MSRSNKMLRLLQRGLPGSVVCKDVLVVLPIRYFITGFLLERTMKRDMVYLWRVVTPIYFPRTGLALDYSERIYDCVALYIDPHDYPGSASRVLEIIGDEHVAYLRSIRTPEDFLLRHERAMGDRPIIPEDISDLRWRDFVHALTHYLIGHHDIARQAVLLMEQEILRHEDKWRLYRIMKEPVQSFVRASGVALSEGLALLARWSNENVEKFGLQEAMRLSAELEPESGGRITGSDR
jgi:hypothetical protein